jgi:hypothetical protein
MDGPVATIAVPTTGVHTISVWMRESGFRLDRLLLTTTTTTPTSDGPPESERADGSGVPPTPTPTPAPTATPPSDIPDGTFLSASGSVTIEGEHFTDRIDRNAQSWVERTNRAGYVGTGFMVAEPNRTLIDSAIATTSPELQYRVHFEAAGTYYVWLRGFAANSSSDSVHVGLDGVAVTSADRMTLATTGQFVWFETTMDGPRATITVAAPGLHVVNVWNRESGFRVDRLLLTLDSAFTPAGNGPAESERTGSGAALFMPASGKIPSSPIAAVAASLLWLLAASLIALAMFHRTGTVRAPRRPTRPLRVGGSPRG